MMVMQVVRVLHTFTIMEQSLFWSNATSAFAAGWLPFFYHSTYLARISGK